MSFVRKANAFLITVFVLLSLLIDIIRFQRHQLSIYSFPKQFPLTLIILIMILFVRWIGKSVDKTKEAGFVPNVPTTVSAFPALSPQEFKRKVQQIQAKIPGLKWQEKDREIEVLPNSNSGFLVSILFEEDPSPENQKKQPLSVSEGVLDDPIEYAVYYLADHVHFSKGREAEALSMFLMGLSDTVQLKVVSRSGVDYEFSTEIKAKNQGSYSQVNRTVLIKPVLWKFWIKKEVRYLQNRYLTGIEMENMFKELIGDFQGGPFLS